MTTTSRDVRTTAAKGADAMTLAEVKEFVTEMDRAGAAGTTPIIARVGWHGQLKSLSATAIRFGDGLPPGQQP